MDTDIIAKSRQYINEGKYEKAQIILRRALDETPNRAQVLELCGDLAVKLGRLNEAVTRYEHAFENYTNSGQYAEAIISLEKILMIDEMNESILFRLVDLYHFYGLPNEAIKKLINFASKALEKKNETLFISALRKIIEFQPKNLQLRLSFAKLLFSLNRVKEAEDELIKLRGLASEINDENILNEIRRLLPKTDGGEELDPKSRIELGNLLYEIGSRDEAIIEFKKAADDLIREGKYDDAVNVLNRILEIDPDNSEALQKLKELRPGAKAEEKLEVPQTEMKKEGITLEITPEELKPEIPLAPKVEETVTEIQSDLEILADLSKEIEGFTPITEEIKPSEKPVPETPVEEKIPEVPVAETKSVEVPPLEGQIADIDFLLKETEVVPVTPRNFEVAKQFDELRTSITWGIDDVNKKVNLARMAVDSGLYEIVLSYLEEEKNKKEFWPGSVEILGQALIKLGKYSEAIKLIGPILLLEEIPEEKKIELRYLLASGYEGLGDFENALREIEHIMAINPDYRDIREIYTLLGGEMVVPATEQVSRMVEEKTPKPEPAFEETPKLEAVKEPEPLTEKFVYEEPIKERPEESHVELSKDIIEEPYTEEKISFRDEYPEEGRIEVEEKGENITFL
ncbi:MAG: tetratricopeptide repeat protein [candidate division WOR-3 bacterium]|nr:tetratricopeptide repeat protein [candidate division WOR-3 bacterium]